MNSQQFKQLQPVAYQMIHHSIQENQLAHAYLFVAPEGVELFEYAELFCQSLLCQNKVDGLACLECEYCLKISNGVYVDMIVLSKQTKTMGKADVVSLVSQFNKTALEQQGLKFYIIQQVESASVEALNSLLKFLEEPGNQMTYAILTSNHLERVLPTVVSRCLVVPFKRYPLDKISDELVSYGLNSANEYLVAQVAKDPTKALELIDNQVYNRSLQVFRDYLAILANDFESAYLLVVDQGLIDKSEDRFFLEYWLMLNIQFFKDLNRVENFTLGWYSELLDQYRIYKNSSASICQVFMGGCDQLLRSPNLLLMVDKIFWQLREVI